ncbi:hypothetical protein PAMP_000233 [Pampus punctatissimus]
MSLQWELEYKVSQRPRQVVYIRTEADISALTYPNKRHAVCCPASTGGAGGGDRGGRKSENREKVVVVVGEYEDRVKQELVGVSTQYNHLLISPSGPRGEKHQLAYKAKHETRCYFKALDLDPVTDLESFSHV